MKILFCATDAGGARNLAPVINYVREKKYILKVLSGIRTSFIFKNEGIKATNIEKFHKKDVRNLINKYHPDIILCGAVRHNMHLPELDIIEYSKIINIPVTVILDEWFIYAKRFWNDKKELYYLPNLILCPDNLAQKEAIKEGIPKNILKITGSPAYSYLARNNAENSIKKKQLPKKILFISESITNEFGRKENDSGILGTYIGYTEYSVRNELSKVLNFSKNEILLIEKLHPNQFNQKFKKIKLKGKSEWKTKKQYDIKKLLYEADIVIGMMSAVLLEAYLLGKIVISFQPNLLGQDKCTASRLGFIPLITNNKDLKVFFDLYLNKNKIKPKDIKLPNFCDKNASKKVLNELLKITKKENTILGALTHKNIVLRPFTESMITKKYIGWLNDKIVTQYSEQRHYEHTYRSCKQYFIDVNKNGNIFYAIFIKNKHIGNIVVYIDSFNKTANLTILIGEKQYWGKGIGLIAFNLMKNYLLFNLNIRKVWAGTASVNKAMIKIMKSSGMKPDGIRKKELVINNTAVDVIYYSIFNKYIN